MMNNCEYFHHLELLLPGYMKEITGKLLVVGACQFPVITIGEAGKVGRSKSRQWPTKPTIADNSRQWPTTTDNEVHYTV